MLILLGVSTALAVVTPDVRDPDRQEESTTPTGPTGATGPAGDPEGEGPDETDPETEDPSLAVETVETGKAARKGGPPPVATAEASGRLVLTVDTGGPADVAIPEFGQIAVATEYAPAVFDLLMPDKAGTFKVIDDTSGATLAEIKIKG